ncbi:MAG: geranylgeranyl reductase family protein [Candidatus Hodarchaeota archaeon]
MNSCDIAIIGGGPCGSLAAISALSHDKSNIVKIFEKRKKSGYPPHCSGLIGIEGLKTLQHCHTIARKTSYNRIRHAKFISPSGKTIIISRRRSELFVLDRPRLDSYLAKRAQKLGAILQYQNSVKKIQLTIGSQWKLHYSFQRKLSSQIKSKIIISAEGHHPKISLQAGLPSPARNWYLPAIQYDLDNVSISDKEMVELYFSSKIAPGFFAWMIPLNENQARFGLAIHPYLSQGARRYLNYVIKKHPILSPKLKNGVILNSWGGFVPASGPISRTFSDGFLVVGDAAGQSKATTGGGFNIGGYCGLIAGRIASESIQRSDYSKKFLKRYQQLWRSKFEPDLSLMKLFRRALSFLRDKTLDDLFDIAIQTDLANSMHKVRDIDLHGFDILKYSLSPKVIIRGLQHSPDILISLFHGLLV